MREVIISTEIDYNLERTNEQGRCCRVWNQQIYWRWCTN